MYQAEGAALNKELIYNALSGLLGIHPCQEAVVMEQVKKADILIKNCRVADFSDPAGLPGKRSIVICGEEIVDICGTDLAVEKYDPDMVVPADSKIAMPGFINAHSHAGMSYFKGLADDLPLMEWLSQHIWPAEKRFLTAEFVHDAALHGCVEMMKNGITCFCDMYFFGDQAAQAAQQAGIRAVVGEGVMDAPETCHENPDEIFAYVRRMHEKYKNDPLIDFAVAPHSVYTCCKETLKGARDLAGELGLLLNIHLAEHDTEVRDMMKSVKMRPVEFLDSIGFFENDVLAAHGIWLDETEMKILAQRDVSLALNLSANFKLASGAADVKNLLKNNVNLCLGTDSVASNNNLSMMQEMSLAAKVFKMLYKDPAFLPAREVVEMATIKGARALKKENEIGSLEIGKKADVILVDTADVSCLPIYDIYSHAVYAFSSEHVKDVIINGQMVMKDRIPVNVDENELVERADMYRDMISS